MNKSTYIKNVDNKIMYIDILRIIACFMVIVNHSVGLCLNHKTFLSSTFYCLSFSICKIGVPIFLMITGALILDKDYSYPKVFKCIIRVLQ